MGVYDVDWNSHLFYKEGIADGTGKMHDYFMTNDEAINGNGFDLKLGVILRPIKKSPFRIRFSILYSYMVQFNREQYPVDEFSICCTR